MQASSFDIIQQGENALLLNWSQQIDPVVNHQVMSAFRRITQLQLPWVRDLIPAYASLTVVYDALYIYAKINKDVADWVSLQVRDLLDDITATEVTAGRDISIPVCYDPSLGLDVEALAAQKNLSLEQLIALHTGRTYRVYMLGFLPGFPYMGTVDERLIAPRLSKPRPLVPAGSVGIAGAQTGVYPLASPGGWNIIGQTPLRMFDPERTPAAWCQPGDQVTFEPISIEQFHQLKSTS
ncbi:5-oxoprolinase subunit PxpB [Chitinophaga horti]|uniref:5-oxoprolinase subunit PxpB n=1 Tax=Chitinophaga horti TaxID=2920382 RepID=A0ABY6JAW5_9BACT|nr:5-oxoprolinase subunit PxpB [Chitinophaga horti]UYQ95319.1 5-oxoprolinase subunit PxpB [Chitinophaga horti]